MQSPVLVSDRPQVMPAAELVGRLHRELAHLASGADALQELVGGLAGRLSDGERGRVIMQIQDLDLLVQRLHGLSGFLGVLERTIPAHWSIDATHALAGLLLGAQARALGGAEPDATQAEDDGVFLAF